MNKNIMQRFIKPAFLVLLTALLIVTVALATPGDLDPSFDGDGIVNPSAGAGFDPIAIQPDGKLVVAGSVGIQPHGDFAVARYNPDGSRDTTFGTNGVASTDLGSDSHDLANGVALQPDGKIVLAGESNANGTVDFAVVRYCSDGSLDDGVNCGGTGFGSNGAVFTAIGSAGTAVDRGNTVAIQTDGKIVVGGYSRGTTLNDFAVVRYCSNGSLDDGVNCGGAGFGTGGVVITDLGGNQDQIYAIAIQADGKIVAGGYVGPTSSLHAIQRYDFAVARYNSDGSLDTTFDTDGIVTTHSVTTGSPPNLIDWDDFLYDLAIQYDGKIVGIGYSHHYKDGSHDNIFMVRYNIDGSLDDTFDGDPEMDDPGINGVTYPGNGRVTTDINVRDDQAYGLALQYDGKIVVVGQTINSDGDQDFFIVRYKGEDGSLDKRFSADGKAVTTIGAVGTNDRARGVALQDDGKLVAVGTRLVRYEVVETATETVVNGGTSTNLPDVTITNNSGGSCDFTVSRYPVPPGCGAPEPGEVPMHWEITSTCAPVNVDLAFDYTDLELATGNNITEANLRVFKHTGSPTWTSQCNTDGGPYNCVLDAGTNTLSISGVTSLSSWTLGDAGTTRNSNPTAISLSSFKAQNSGALLVGSLSLLIILGMGGGYLLWRRKISL